MTNLATSVMKREFDYDRETVNLVWPDTDTMWVETDRKPTEDAMEQIKMIAQKLRFKVKFKVGGKEWPKDFLPDDADRRADGHETKV